MPIRERKGFSLIEILFVILFVGIISVVVIANLFGTRSRTELDSTTKQITALLREAQSRSISQDESAIWGVRLDNNTTTKPFYALFKTSYSEANTVSRFNLYSGVRFATSSIAEGGTLEVTFAQLSGAPSASASITIRHITDATASSTIVVSASGAISF